MRRMGAGRPEIEITDELCKKAETLAAQGLTVKQMASVLGMGESTFYQKQARYLEFLEAVEDGKAKGIATITNALFNKAKKGDTQSIKYYLNNRDRDNWKDRVDSTMSGPDGGPVKTDGKWTIEFVNATPKDK